MGDGLLGQAAPVLGVDDVLESIAGEWTSEYQFGCWSELEPLVSVADRQPGLGTADDDVKPVSGDHDGGECR